MIKRGLVLLIVFFAIGFSTAENITDNSTIELNNTNITIIDTPKILLTGIIPKQTEIGDVQILIQIQNKNNETLSNPAIFISGNGYSTYEITTIDDLAPNEKGYFVVSGNFKEIGEINLSIKINKESFYQIITITNKAGIEQEVIDQEKISNLTIKLNSLKEQYNNLSNAISERKKNNYDVSSIFLTDAKEYLRNAETNLITESVISATANLQLAEEEIKYQTTSLSKTEKIPFMETLKQNILPFSVIAGALITFFALEELLKKKSEKVIEKVATMKKTKINNSKKKKLNTL